MKNNKANTHVQSFRKSLFLTSKAKLRNISLLVAGVVEGFSDCFRFEDPDPEPVFCEVENFSDNL
jgi:hypothetical protein